MYRQSPSRNHRSKGIKVKNVLQICLLLAVCFWLIYQIKHTHDKKKEFDESDAKASSNDELLRFGRKDIRSRVDGALNKDDKDEPLDEEDVNGDEVEENKHEEDELEDKKIEVKEDDGMGGGDDETDEHEPEKSDEEAEREKDLIDGEEREEGDEIETQNTDSEDGHEKIEKESNAEDTDHDGDDGGTHEAREEFYKADDASSAVTHDSQAGTAENNNGHVDNSNQETENNLEGENKEIDGEETYTSENRKELEVGGGEVAGNSLQSNVTTSETNADVLDISRVASESSQNNTVTEGLNDHLGSNSTGEVTMEDHDLLSENVTETKPELGHDQGNLTEGISASGSDSQTINPEQANNSLLNGVDSNSTDSAANKDSESLSEEFSNSSNNSTASSASENILTSEASVEAGNATESILENNNEIEGEKSDTSDGNDESSEITMSENSEEVQQDGIDISDTSGTLDEKDIRTDLETLPEIQTEGTNDDEAAAE